MQALSHQQVNSYVAQSAAALKIDAKCGESSRGTARLFPTGSAEAQLIVTVIPNDAGADGGKTVNTLVKGVHKMISGAGGSATFGKVTDEADSFIICYASND